MTVHRILEHDIPPTSKLPRIGGLWFILSLGPPVILSLMLLFSVVRLPCGLSTMGGLFRAVRSMVAMYCFSQLDISLSALLGSACSSFRSVPRAAGGDLAICFVALLPDPCFGRLLGIWWFILLLT